jgi:hypothetical protein
MSLDSILDFYWCMAKIMMPKSETVKIVNSLANLNLDLYQKHQVIDMLQAAATLSLKTTEDIDWKKDIEKKLAGLSKKLEENDNLNTAKSMPMNISALYKSLVFFEAKYGIQQIPEYFSSKQMEFFKQEWLRSIKRFRASKLEEVIADIIKQYIQEQNLNKSIQQNSLADIFIVDIIIEPNIVVEINGKSHFIKDSSLNVHKDYYAGNYLTKIEYLKLKGYKLVMLNQHEFEDILDNQQELKNFVIERIAPYL